MQQIITGTIIFITLVIVIELFIYTYKKICLSDSGRIVKRLRKATYIEDEQIDTGILKKRVLSEIPFLNRLLIRTPGILKLDKLISQANAKYPIGFYILLTFVFALCGLVIGTFVIKSKLAAISIALIGSFIPFLYLYTLKRRRIEKFRKQLPEALDLMARALKAGHAFTNGLKLAADEFDDPLGPEFIETLDEINFGLSVPQALRNLSERMDCSEVKYFVMGVILQRETGGNLSELMGILSALIREKYKFQAKVRTLSAEGRLSAIVLIVLPFLVAAWIWFSTPEYMNILWSDPIGKIMIIGAAVLMAAGILVMKKMVQIEV
jgi:tight adherence protein B